MEGGGEWVFAWCGGCGFAKRFAERVCVRGVPAGVRGWECEECVDAARAAAQAAAADDAVVRERVVQDVHRARECPKCGVMTEKTYGCDHISCPCGAHWCYACGEEAGEDTIYDHMSSRHDGLWGGEWDEDEDDEEQ